MWLPEWSSVFRVSYTALSWCVSGPVFLFLAIVCRTGVDGSDWEASILFIVWLRQTNFLAKTYPKKSPYLTQQTVGPDWVWHSYVQMAQRKEF